MRERSCYVPISVGWDFRLRKIRAAIGPRLGGPRDWSIS